MADPLTKAAESMWVSVPLRLQRRYASLRGVVGDWYGVALAPPLAVLSVLITAATYGTVGALGVGYADLYSESLLLMASLIALGAFSGQLGLIGLVSFALGDFVFRDRLWTLADTSVVEELVRTRVPLIISYLLLAVAVIVIPRLGKNIAVGVGQWKRIPTDLAWLVSTPVVVLVSWLGLRTWAAMAPTLLRPYFYWRFASVLPPVETIEVLQTDADRLVAAGVAATVVRQAMTALAIYLPRVGDRLTELEARAYHRVMGDAEAVAAPSTPSRWVLLRGDLLSALTATLVLSGILETSALWFSYFIAFFVVRILRSGTVRFGLLNRWKLLAGRVPVVARLAFMWVGAVLYRSLLTNEAIGSYSAMALVVLIGVVASFLIFPGQPGAAQPANSGAGQAPAARVGVAG